MPWYFLRSPACDEDGAQEMKRLLRSVGTVQRSGLGTEVDPTAAWFVVRAGKVEVQGIRDRLRDLGLSDRIDLIEPIRHPTDGQAIARQLALF